MNFPRSSGILLHPTSLPGPFGIGDLGPAAYAFADYLVTSGQSLWQMLPLGPTGYGDSPYACYSAFAGNTLLISPEQLVAEGLLSPSDFPQDVSTPAERVNFERVHEVKDQLLRKAYQNYKQTTDPVAHSLREAFEQFTQHSARWLDDYALFRGLKRRSFISSSFPGIGLLSRLTATQRVLSWSAIFRSLWPTIRRTFGPIPISSS